MDTTHPDCCGDNGGLVPVFPDPTEMPGPYELLTYLADCKHRIAMLMGIANRAAKFVDGYPGSKEAVQEVLDARAGMAHICRAYNMDPDNPDPYALMRIKRKRRTRKPP